MTTDRAPYNNYTLRCEARFPSDPSLLLSISIVWRDFTTNTTLSPSNEIVIGTSIRREENETVTVFASELTAMEVFELSDGVLMFERGCVVNVMSVPVLSANKTVQIRGMF